MALEIPSLPSSDLNNMVKLFLKPTGKQTPRGIWPGSTANSSVITVDDYGDDRSPEPKTPKFGASSTPPFNESNTLRFRFPDTSPQSPDAVRGGGHVPVTNVSVFVSEADSNTRTSRQSQHVDKTAVTPAQTQEPVRYVLVQDDAVTSTDFSAAAQECTGSRMFNIPTTVLDKVGEGSKMQSKLADKIDPSELPTIMLSSGDGKPASYIRFLNDPIPYPQEYEHQELNIDPYRKPVSVTYRNDASDTVDNKVMEDIEAIQRMEQEHVYPESRMEQERVYPESRMEQEHVYPESRMEQEHVYPESRMEQEHVYPESRMEQEHVYPESRMEQEHFYPESQMEQEHVYPASTNGNYQLITDQSVLPADQSSGSEQSLYFETVSSDSSSSSHQVYSQDSDVVIDEVAAYQSVDETPTYTELVTRPPQQSYMCSQQQEHQIVTHSQSYEHYSEDQVSNLSDDYSRHDDDDYSREEPANQPTVSTTVNLKNSLKNKIQLKRLQEGKGELRVSFENRPIGEPSEEEKLKAKMRKQKNRESAVRSRLRRQEQMKYLEKEVKQLEKENKQLERDIRALKEENVDLKNFECDCGAFSTSTPVHFPTSDDTNENCGVPDIPFRAALSDFLAREENT